MSESVSKALGTVEGARFLLDTSVLLSVVDTARAHHAVAVAALAKLKREGARLHITPQNLVELWAVATRPAEANGLGHSTSEVAGLLLRFQLVFTMVPETPEIFVHWERIVLAYGVQGKPTHDARLIAAMKAHRLTHLLTFNDRDFRRFEGTASQGEDIMISNPANVAIST